MDIFTKEKRSEVMSKIRSESMLEERFRKILCKELYPLGYRYRKNYKSLPGKPDIVFVTQKIAIFIDGDFWHGYQYKTRSKNYSKFWKDKIGANIERDLRDYKLLKKMGWTYVRFWEHEIKKDPKKRVVEIKTLLKRNVV